jgi:hypothetical protein
MLWLASLRYYQGSRAISRCGANKEILSLACTIGMQAYHPSCCRISAMQQTMGSRRPMSHGGDTYFIAPLPIIPPMMSPTNWDEITFPILPIERRVDVFQQKNIVLLRGWNRSACK